jgi:hypothetical protein
VGAPGGIQNGLREFKIEQPLEQYTQGGLFFGVPCIFMWHGTSFQRRDHGRKAGLEAMPSVLANAGALMALVKLNQLRLLSASRVQLLKVST